MEEIKNINVLFADDCLVHQKLFQIIMDKLVCFQLDFVENGLDLVKSAGSKSYDIIFVDLNMPIMNGDEAVRIIREELKLGCKIVGVTAETTQNIMKRTGYFDKVITKPYNIEIIHEIIKEFF